MKVSTIIRLCLSFHLSFIPYMPCQDHMSNPRCSKFIETMFFSSSISSARWDMFSQLSSSFFFPLSLLSCCLTSLFSWHVHRILTVFSYNFNKFLLFSSFFRGLFIYVFHVQDSCCIFLQNLVSLTSNKAVVQYKRNK